MAGVIFNKELRSQEATDKSAASEGLKDSLNILSYCTFYCCKHALYEAMDCMLHMSLLCVDRYSVA